MTSSSRILGIGYTALDHFFYVDSYPSLDTKTEARGSLLQGGGPVATACVTLARLGNPVDFCTVIGDDPAGKALITELDREGVGTRYVLQETGLNTPEAAILVHRESGKRTVILDRTGCRHLTKQEICQLPLDQVDWLLLDGKDGEAALAAAAQVRQHGGKVMVDLGSLRVESDQLVAASDYCIVSRDFIMDFMPGSEAMAAALELTTRGPELAVITLGAGGAVFAAAGEAAWVPPYPVAATDTTGAGDVYHGALLHALVHQFPLEQTLRFAAVVAGLKCREPGGRTGIPRLDSAMTALLEWE